MHPHIRSNTKKRPARLSPRRSSPARTSAPGTPATVVLEANEEELSHLAGDLAYFRVARYREVDPGDVREEDIKCAEAEIAALFKHEDQE
jgi:hypothetical protein